MRKGLDEVIDFYISNSVKYCAHIGGIDCYRLTSQWNGMVRHVCREIRPTESCHVRELRDNKSKIDMK